MFRIKGGGDDNEKDQQSMPVPPPPPSKGIFNSSLYDDVDVYALLESMNWEAADKDKDKDKDK